MMERTRPPTKSGQAADDQNRFTERHEEPADLGSLGQGLINVGIRSATKNKQKDTLISKSYPYTFSLHPHSVRNMKIVNAVRTSRVIIDLPKAKYAKDTAPGGIESELPDFPSDFTVIYITTEHQANDALKYITDGTVGFDTEFTDRRPTREEKLIIDAIPASAIRKYALAGWQLVELSNHPTFPIAWDNIGLRLVQIYRDGDAWSSDIKKSGAGLIKDIAIIWDDIRMEMKNLVDAGMMARLYLAEKYPKVAYANLALQSCVEEILGYKFPKELASSNWAKDELSPEQITYAAQDAVACYRLHTLLEPLLAQKSIDVDTAIPSAWYTFNTRYGEPTRIKRGADGNEVIWKQSDCTWYGGGRFIGYP
ncbi:ribonuclease H-like domain-containing protein [Mycena crocata]|nr:ribonuclease H-like domain-containing protein [Mycena crocata]